VATALSLAGLRRRIEALMLPDSVDVRLILDRATRLERDRRRRRWRKRQAIMPGRAIDEFLAIYLPYWPTYWPDATLAAAVSRLWRSWQALRSFKYGGWQPLSQSPPSSR
jgi:hypothetical protein